MKDRTQIGPYEIIAPLGAGGMGEVFRARDSRLNREVAIKLLPAQVAGDASRRQRFLEEARAAGALNHPNIVAVYDVGVDDEGPFIVSELVDGNQLRDEIDRGGISTKRLLDLAVQVASGMCAAHDAGIVHRDLKPENVMVARDGRAKILDFGLAKVYAAATGDAATMFQGTTMTVPGMILGTPAYMSPEQASGRAVDFRSDQFSFGLILYEMATGANPFRRPTHVQTMSAIVADEPTPVAEINAKVPLPLRWVIERCLAKDPADRYASTTDLAKDLTTLQARLPEASVEPLRLAAGPTARRRWTLVGAVGVLAFATVALVAWSGPAEVPAVKFTPVVTDARFQGAPAWSPDGNTLAYVSAVDGILQVLTRSLVSAMPNQVTHSRFDCTDPFWSPDGTRIFYHSLAHETEGLWSVSAAGGQPEIVTENANGAIIARDGRTLVYFNEGAPEQRLEGDARAIWLASPTGANARRYAQPPFDKRTFVDGTLRFSPDGSKLLAWVWGWADPSNMVPTSEFWLLPWPSGTPRKILPSLSRSTPAAASFDWIDERRVVMSLWDPGTGTHLWMADVNDGTLAPLTSTPGSENRPAVSPDRRTIAFASESVDFDLMEIPLDGAAARPLLATSRNELDPSFALDGSQYVYVSDKGGPLQIWLRSRDGQFERPVVSAAQFRDGETITLGAPALSPKGDRIAYQRSSERGGYEIWVSTVAAAGPPVQLAPGSHSYYQDAPAWSPDGEWVAFVERAKAAVTPAKGTDRVGVPMLAKARVGANRPPEVILEGSPIVESRPRWSPDGRWIACETTDGLIVVSPTGKESHVISPDVWIAFTWAPDSRHIYGLREAERPRHYALAIIDVEKATERIVNPDLGEIPPASQPIRGLSMVGTTALATSLASARSDIWLAAGLTREPRTWLAGFWRK